MKILYFVNNVPQFEPTVDTRICLGIFDSLGTQFHPNDLFDLLQRAKAKQRATDDFIRACSSNTTVIISLHPISKNSNCFNNNMT